MKILGKMLMFILLHPLNIYRLNFLTIMVIYRSENQAQFDNNFT